MLGDTATNLSLKVAMDAHVEVVDDDIAPRSVIAITLSADHRVSDGHAGTLFLAEIGKLLMEPDKL